MVFHVSFYTSLWDEWTRLFSPLPYGDPWVASFAAVFAVVGAFKLFKSFKEYV